ncbi:hypothetical protein H6790_02940 [Candidatus Nomurabacteria bacterium]|nr:hypothetical protein [Candidatus Nomurabacteria bacterium]MCB9820874.1 hypothetical protein [Candidatus Nomurabacteria bacterium]
MLAVVILGSLAFVTGYTGSNDSNLVGGVFKGAKKVQDNNPKSDYQVTESDSSKTTIGLYSGEDAGKCVVITTELSLDGSEDILYGTVQYNTDGAFAGCLVGDTLWTAGPGVVIYQGNPYDPDIYPTIELYIDYLTNEGIPVNTNTASVN